MPAPTSPAGTCHTRTSREAPRIDSAGAPRIGTGIATRASVFAATGARRARADRDRERAHELMRPRSSRSESRPGHRRRRRASRGSRDRNAPFAGRVPRARFHPSRSAIRFSSANQGALARPAFDQAPRSADRPTPSPLATQLHPRGRPRRQEPLRPCVRTPPRGPPQFKATLIASGRRSDAAIPLGSLAFSRFLRPGSKRLTFLSLSSSSPRSFDETGP